MADPTIGAFTSEIQGLRTALKGLQSDIAKLSGGGSTSTMMPNYAATASTNLFYSGNEGQSGYNNMGLASGFFAKLMPKTAAATGKIMQGGGATLAAAGYATSLMPGMEKYLVRETGYYQAGVSGMGALGLGDLKTYTRSGIGQGNLTAVGSDATVAAILAGRGMRASTDYNSTYQQTLRGVGNAAKYLNQSNEVAAQSMESLTSGATSSSLLSRGIFTSGVNPTTGKNEPFKEQQIFEQLWNRWVSDKSITKSEMQDEIRRGFIGANIDSLDIDPAAKERLKVFLIAHSRDDGLNGKAGVSLDITNTESMDKAFSGDSALATGGYSNPMTPAYQLAGQETNYVDTFASNYAKGFQSAADAIGDLQQTVIEADKATGFLSDSMKQLSAFMATFMGSDIGAGFASGGWMVAAADKLALAGKSGTNALENFFSGGAAGAGGTSGTVGADPGGAWESVMPANSVIPGGADYGATGAVWSGSHHGIDFWAPIGTEVYAAYDGTVDKVNMTPNGQLGINIVLRHGDGWTSTYAHLSEVKVVEEQTVTKGTLIGYTGDTGVNVDGSKPGKHLHFAVAKNGTYVNPNTFTDTIAMGLKTGGGGNATTVSGSSASGSYSPTSGSSVLAASVLGSGSGSVALGSVGTSSSGGGGGGNNVTINVTIAQASDAEALRLADMVKAQLQQDSFMTNMGAY